MGMDDLLLLLEEDLPSHPVTNPIPWKILVVDDDKDMHQMTNLVLSNLPPILGRRVSVLTALSAKQALEIITDNPDISVALIDVVMETDSAGLDLVQAIRNDLKNDKIRLVLRTGQPGYAPEVKIISEYDIDGYLDKAYTTTTKLQTTLYTSLRAYTMITTLHRLSKGFEHIIDAMIDLSQRSDHFVSGVLEQLISIINCSCTFVCTVEQPKNIGVAATLNRSGINIVSTVGDITPTACSTMIATHRSEIANAALGNTVLYLDTGVVLVSKEVADSATVVYLVNAKIRNDNDRLLINKFAESLSIFSKINRDHAVPIDNIAA